MVKKFFRKMKKYKILGIPILMLLLIVAGAIFIKPVREMIDGKTGNLATNIYNSIMSIFSKNDGTGSDLSLEEEIEEEPV